MAAYFILKCRASVSFFLLVVSLVKVLSLNVVGKPATQSSTTPDYLGETFEAGNAVDGDLSTFTHTAYDTAEQKTNPWWRLDLEDIYCLRNITIYNRLDAVTASRLAGAVIRAGLNSDRPSNRVIGTVTPQQAIDNSPPIEIIADPMVTARYVSVDLPGTNKILHMREVEVGEYLDTEGGGEEVDFTLVANPALLGQTGDDNAIIAAYKGPNDISADVSFGRQVTTGGSNDLPSGSNQLQDPLLGCQVRQLNLPEEGGIDRTGVFYCEATRVGRTNTTTQTIILPKDGSVVHVRPVQRTQIANVGDSIQLEMRNVHAPNTNYRWRHNGGDVITSWNDQLSVSIDDVAVSDGGVYSCFVSDQEDQQLHGIMRLIVRGCSEGMWGPPSCLNTCRQCFNGGVCDDKTGTCICAPGFSGEYCQQVFGRNIFGQNAGHRCSNATDPHDDACRGRLFCLPDPYGCSCAAGFTGLDCMQECPEGTYGADCKQTCHCAPGDTCIKYTGECSSGVCDLSYCGINCQFSSQPVEVTTTSILQRSLGFAWQGPECAITGFAYKLTDVGSGAVLRLNFTSEKSVIIDGLVPYTQHSFQAAATFSTGTGMYSAPVNVTTLEAEPSAPVNINTQSVDDVSITITWSPPNSPNGIITNYDIAFWKSDAGTQTLRDDIGVSPLVYRLDSLESSTMYHIQVRAKTSAGAGPWSDTVTASTQNGAIDGPVIAGIVVGVLLAIVVAVVIGYLVWRRKRDRDRKSAPNTPRPDDHKIELSVVGEPSMNGIESPTEEDIESVNCKDVDVGLPAWAEGEVRAGSLKHGGETSKVAIKTLKG